MTLYEESGRISRDVYEALAPADDDVVFVELGDGDIVVAKRQGGDGDV